MLNFSILGEYWSSESGTENDYYFSTNQYSGDGVGGILTGGGFRMLFKLNCVKYSYEDLVNNCCPI